MRFAIAFVLVFALGSLTSAAEPSKPNALTPQEIADGWILLFDGESTFGWNTDGTVVAQNGVLALGGAKTASATTTSMFGYCKVRFEFRLPKELAADFRYSPFQSWRFTDWVQVRDPAVVDADGWIASEWHIHSPPNPNRVQTTHRMQTRFGPGLKVDGAGFCTTLTGNRGHIGLNVAPGGSLAVRSIKLRPLEFAPIFNGKDLSDWKIFSGDNYESKFTVTSEGWLNVKNGPGDLQSTQAFSDFIFQGECISNGHGLNSGVFFRCIPGQYQQGYEFQISNKADPKSGKPSDFGTGGIYRRVPARKLVAKDGEWFTMTLIACGNRFTTWVNGIMTADWADDRPPHENPRKGFGAAAGHLSLQGHDPTTDLSFRNFRVFELKSN